MALLLDLLVTGQTRLNDDTYAKNIYADKFIRTGSSDSYVLLGGGGHKLLSEFYKVTQTVTTASNTSWRPFIVGMSYNDSEPFAPTTVTDSVYATHKLRMQPSTGNIQTYGYVKLYAATAGTINICKVSASGTSSILTTESHAVEEGINIIHLSNPITLSSTISIGFAGGGIVSMYNYQGVDPIGWEISRVGTDTEYPNIYFPIDFGYIDI
jgi:hypothetical protein